MSCPTCDHTMQSLGGGGDDAWFWCPRCGTLLRRSLIGDGVSCEAPDLVGRLRAYARNFSDIWKQSIQFKEWVRHGIAEAISKPEDRPHG